MAFFTELEQINLQIFMQPQKILNSQSSLKKEESWSYYAPWLQTILQSYSNQNSIVLSQKQTHKINGTEQRTEINPYLQGQLVYDEWGKSIQWEKDILSKITGEWKIRQRYYV